MVLLVVDTQKGITDERLYGFKELEVNIKTLLGKQKSKHFKMGFRTDCSEAFCLSDYTLTNYQKRIQC